jgi:hypothetical protein
MEKYFRIVEGEVVADAPNYIARISAIWAYVSSDSHGEGLCGAPFGDITLPLIAADEDVHGDDLRCRGPHQLGSVRMPRLLHRKLVEHDPLSVGRPFRRSRAHVRRRVRHAAQPRAVCLDNVD